MAPQRNRLRPNEILRDFIWQAFHGAGRNTLSILRINPPKIGGELKFEPNAGIAPKGVFFKGLNDLLTPAGKYGKN